MIHIKIYILAQLYHKRQQRLIYVHIPHKESNSSIISQFRVFNGLSTSHLTKTTLNRYEYDSSYSNLHGVEKVVDPSNFLPLWHKAPKREEKKKDQYLLVIFLDVRLINIITSCSSPGTTTILVGVNTCTALTVSSGGEASGTSGTPRLLSLTVSL